MLARCRLPNAYFRFPDPLDTLVYAPDRTEPQVNMMHVVVDARTLSARFPGIGRYVSNLLRALTTELGPGERISALAMPDTDLPLGITPIEALDTPLSLTQQRSVPKALERVDADVYHSPYYMMPFRPGVPAILTVHDLIPMLFPERSSLQARHGFPIMLRLALRACVHVIAVSACTRKDLLREFQLSEETASVVTEAPDPRLHPQSASRVEELRHRLRLPGRYVLYVGSNKPHKNLERLLRAWGRIREQPGVRDWHLVMAGRTDERYPEVDRALAKLGPAGRATHLGPIEEDDLAALYTGAGLFVYPSVYEGFGLPVIEAMACGVPVACSGVSSLPEVAGSAARLFEPTDEGAIGAAMLELLSKEDERRRMAKASIQQASLFSWQEAARQTLAIYRLAASKPPSE